MIDLVKPEQPVLGDTFYSDNPVGSVRGDRTFLYAIQQGGAFDFLVAPKAPTLPSNLTLQT
ncbi:MAG: hypothetical protein C4523_02100 [Myxococcales bacterium]|nr:MAG: hypothetical protein C4523_02100 [Myxococcales bacterium]